MAQLAEHGAYNTRVVGSIPMGDQYEKVCIHYYKSLWIMSLSKKCICHTHTHTHTHTTNCQRQRLYYTHTLAGMHTHVFLIHTHVNIL